MVRSIKSEVDSQVLYSRTISLIQKVTAGFDVKKTHVFLTAYLHNLDWKWGLRQYMRKLVIMKSKEPVKVSEFEVLEKVIGSKAPRNLVKVIKDYDERFLQLPSNLT